MDLTVVEQKPITLQDVKERLEEAKKISEQLNFRAEKVNAYIQELNFPKKEKTNELKKKIGELNITRLRDRHIVKVLDIMPKDLDSLKAIFTGEAVSIKQEELKQLLEVITQNA